MADLMQLDQADPMRTINPLLGKYHGESEECVALPKAVAGIGAASSWQQGGAIGQSTPIGTPIATFQNGKYQNQYGGNSHAAIYMGPADDGSGIKVLQQFNGTPAHLAIIPFNDKALPRANANAYSVINSGGSMAAPSLDEILKLHQNMQGQTPPPSNTAPENAPADSAPSLDDILKLHQTMTGATPPPPLPPNVVQINGRNAVNNPDGTFSYVGESAPTGNDAYTLPPPSAPGAPAQPPQTLGGAATAIGRAAKEGFQGASIVTPDFQKVLDQVPYVGTLSHIGNTALGAMAGGFKGLQEGVNQGVSALIDPQAGRDAAAMMEVLPLHYGVSGGASISPFIRAQMADNALAYRAPLSPDFRANPLAPGALDRVMTTPQGEVSPAGMMGGVTGKPLESTVGAAQTAASNIPNLTKSEQTTNEIKQLNQTAVDRAGPNGLDTAEYVKGVQPTRAEVEGNVTTSLQQKHITQSVLPDEFNARQVANNEARVQHFNDLAGDKIETSALEKARDDATSASREAAFTNTQPVKLDSIVQAIDRTLAGPAGKETAVRSALQDVRDSLFDKDGKLETDPAIIYGARKNLANMLSPLAQAEKPTLQHAAAHLTDLKGQIDGVIEQGAPGYRQYLSDYADASKEIDAKNLLQSYMTGSKKLTDVNGNMQFTRVQKMLDTFVRDRAKGGVNDAMKLSPDQMQSLFDLRNDLARRNNIDLGKPRGSDTNQLFGIQNRLQSLMNGPAGYVGGQALATALDPLGSGMSNLLTHYLHQVLRDRAAAQSSSAILNRGHELLSSHPEWEGTPYGR